MLAARGNLDHRLARVPDRDAAKRSRALAVLARTGLAAGHAGRRRVALNAAAPGPALGIPGAPGGVFRLVVAAFLLGDEAGRAVGRSTQGGGSALDADPGGPAGVVAGAGSVAAGLALGGPVRQLAALGAVATGAPLGIAPAVGLQPRPRVALSALLADRGAGIAIGFPAGGGGSAGDAQSGGAAFGIAVALRPPPVFAARLAHRPTLCGRGRCRNGRRRRPPGGPRCAAGCARGRPGAWSRDRVRHTGPPGPWPWRDGHGRGRGAARHRVRRACARGVREPGRTWCRHRRPGAQRAGGGCAHARIRGFAPDRAGA